MPTVGRYKEGSMSRFSALTRVGALAIIGCAAFQLLASSAASASRLATIASGGDYLQWTPRGENAAGTLSVSDPGGRVRVLHFVPGEPPIFFLVNAKGDHVPDGTYVWELRLQRQDASPA